MKKTVILMVLLFSFSLSGCVLRDWTRTGLEGVFNFNRPAAPESAVTSYRFRILSIQDAREEKGEQVHPLNKKVLMQQINTRINPSIYSSIEADLRVKIKDYSTAQYRRSSTLNMSIQYVATRKSGKVLVDETYQCVASGTQPLKLDEVIEEQTGVDVFTNPTHEARIWMKMMEDCVADTLIEFHSDIAGAEGSS